MQLATLQLWRLRVQQLVDQLLTLGTHFSLTFDGPQRMAVEPLFVVDGAVRPDPVDLMDALGFEVRNVTGTRLLQVCRVAKGPQRRHRGPMDVQEDDYVVGVNQSDLLRLPISAAQFRAMCHQEMVHNHQPLELRLVRLHQEIVAGPTMDRSHGKLLQALRKVELTSKELQSQHQHIVQTCSFNGTFATSSLSSSSSSWSALEMQHCLKKMQREQKLLNYIRFKLQQIREWVNQDERFQIAMRFQRWYREFSYDWKDHCDQPQFQQQQEQQQRTAMLRHAVSLDTTTPTTSVESNTSNNGLRRQSSLPTSWNASSSSSREAQTMQSTLGSIDVSWINHFPSVDLKWLADKRTRVMEIFCKRLLEGFRLEVDASPQQIESITTDVAMELVKLYIKKRDHCAPNELYREFVRHCRMLHLNLNNPANKQLRVDLISRQLSATRLCEMSSEELAPEALQAMRQARFEKHAQNMIIQEPEGVRLVKTKHGFKEVPIGSSVINSQETGDDQEMAEPADTSEAPQSQTPLPIPTPEPSPMPTPASTPIAIPSANTPVAAVDGVSDAVMTDPASLPVITRSDNQSLEPDDSMVVEFDRVMDIDSQKKSPNNQKRVSFVDSTSNQATHETKPVGQVASDAKKQLIGLEESCRLFHSLFGPSQDVMGQIDQFEIALKETQLATMSKEFMVMPGLNIHRDLNWDASRLCHAKIQLAHFSFEGIDADDVTANILAVQKLRHALQLFRFQWRNHLHHLAREFRITKDTEFSPEQMHKVARNLKLAKVTQVVFHTSEAGLSGTNPTQYHVDIRAQNLVLAHGEGHTYREAKGRAIQEMCSLIKQLVVFNIQWEADQAELERQAAMERNNAATVQRPEPPIVQSKRDGFTASREQKEVVGEADLTCAAPTIGLKRPLGPESMEVDQEPPRQRPRVDEMQRSLPPQSTGPLANRYVDAPPVDVKPQPYFHDTVGEDTQVEPPLPARKALEIQSLDEYQALIKAWVKDKHAVMKKIRESQWDGPPQDVIRFSSHLTFTRIVTKVLKNETFLLRLEALAGTLSVESLERKTLPPAIDDIVAQFEKEVSTLVEPWLQFVKDYELRRPAKDNNIAAGYETRMKFRDIVKTGFQPVGHLEEFCIYVSGRLAVRAACLNQKMAKRASGEQFGDLLDHLMVVQRENRLARTPTTPTPASSVRQTSTANVVSNRSAAPANNAPFRPPPRAPAPAPSRAPVRAKNPNIIESSGDEDDDDDDDGSEYGYSSGEEEYRASTNAAAKSNPAASKNESDEDMSELNKPYDVTSERNTSEDARFRATMRSLFTPRDELCRGIEELRGSLKYRGSAERRIVPNVMATIKIDRFRENIYKVHVAVNDIVSYETREESKADAINRAIDGVLDRLHRIRLLWAHLMNFLHTKMRSTCNFDESFHAMCLANLARVEVAVERSSNYHHHPSSGAARNHSGLHNESGVPATFRIDGFVVYRVMARKSPDHACLLARRRTARFFENLIDLCVGLGSVDQALKEERLDNQMDVDLEGFSSDRFDWKCVIRIEDPIVSNEISEFRVDAKWYVIPGPRGSGGFGAAMPPFANEFVDFQADIVLHQFDRMPMRTFEKRVETGWLRDAFMFFTESPFEVTRFSKAIEAYGNKNAMKTFVPIFEARVGGRTFEVFVVPPGSSVNSSQNNLYWPRFFRQRQLSDLKKVFGLIRERR